MKFVNKCLNINYFPSTLSNFLLYINIYSEAIKITPYPIKLNVSGKAPKTIKLITAENIILE